MSLGTYNNSNNKKKDYSPITYSPVRFFNSESKIDPSSLGFSFWKNLLKISISPMKNAAEGSVPEMDKDNSIDIYLSPLKAKLFLEYATEFRLDPNKFTNIGIGTNKGIIYLTSGKTEFGTDSLFVVIKLMDFEQGSVTSCIAYEFNRNTFGISNYTGGTNFEKNYDFAQFTEFDMFVETIFSYVSSVNYAIAASVIDNNKYENSRLNTKITSIQEKLGIDTNKKSSYNGGASSNNYWNNNGGSNSSPNMNISSSNSPEHYDNYNQLVDDISSMMVED